MNPGPHQDLIHAVFQIQGISLIAMNMRILQNWHGEYITPNPHKKIFLFLKAFEFISLLSGKKGSFL